MVKDHTFYGFFPATFPKFNDKFVSSNLISGGFGTPDHGNTFFETREQLSHSENILEIDKFKMFRRWASFHFPGVSISNTCVEHTVTSVTVSDSGKPSNIRIEGIVPLRRSS